MNISRHEIKTQIGDTCFSFLFVVLFTRNYSQGIDLFKWVDESARFHFARRWDLIVDLNQWLHFNRYDWFGIIWTRSTFTCEESHFPPLLISHRMTVEPYLFSNLQSNINNKSFYQSPTAPSLTTSIERSTITRVHQSHRQKFLHHVKPKTSISLHLQVKHRS